MKSYDMKYLSTVILYCSFFTLFPFNLHASPQERSTVSETRHCVIDGLERNYKLYLPSTLKSKAPLLLVLHGYHGDFNLENIGFNQVAEKYGFAVCYPRGVKDSRGNRCWNVGYPFQEDMNVDDVSFLCKLAKQLKKEYKLGQVFCTGMSNGGEMCYLLAYSGQTVIKAVAPIAGLTLAWMPKRYPKARPIPLFEVHGTEDRTSEWSGDLENKGGWGAYLPVPEAVDFWVLQNKCTEEIKGELPLKTVKSNRVITHKYMNKRTGKDVWLYEIIGGAHSWGQNDLDVAEEVWCFFSRYVD